MFEFTKEEQSQLIEARKAYNIDKMSKDTKEKSKQLFGKMFKGKKDSGRGSARNESFTGSGNTSTQKKDW